MPLDVFQIHLNATAYKVQFSPFEELGRRGWGGGMGVGGHEGRFSRDPRPAFSERGSCEPFWYWQGCPFFDVVHPAFPLTTKASPTLQGALKDDFGEAVVA